MSMLLIMMMIMMTGTLYRPHIPKYNYTPSACITVHPTATRPNTHLLDCVCRHQMRDSPAPTPKPPNHTHVCTVHIA